MFNISGFFSAIRNAHAREIAARTVIRDVVREKTGVELELSGICLRNGMVSLKNASPAVRNLIFIKKESILLELATRYGDGTIRDIR